MKTQEMLSAHPKKPVTEVAVITACIDACVECAEVCTSCADACLGEEKVQTLTKCIRVNLDCADVCQTTARILTRQTEVVPQLLRAQLESCVISCRVCAQECETHAEMHQHCRICRSVCQNTEKICQEILTRLPFGAGVSI